ncbi:hypothetical protein QWY85_14120 [Neolewinella lacunae]|uniref:Uncharacterized protein n=1 Tax=Neolewinella lacunae TaxID=1517758 RepID=A0A923PME3_9BACT|nr:hypothetical protein [Neolewinella lacunae]MBC6994351.1 hypothetical protein [Neolewinella lacunae]MDN3635802.1 hypothetical protein [Neolewinella lacunae]
MLLANVVNYALGEWLERQTPGWAAPLPQADGSTFNTSRFFQARADTALATRPDAEALLDYYTYLDQGGSQAYLRWQAARQELRAVSTPFLQRAFAVAAQANAGKYLALLLFIVTLLLLYGRGLRESNWSTPLLYFAINAGTAALFGSLVAPLFTAVMAGLWLLYFVGLRLYLPIYHTEWSRLMRPSLTLCLFLLAVMAWRGPQLLSYWFWTSPLFRLGLTLVTLLAVFFHWSILATVLKAAKMDLTARFFAYGMPLGTATLILGLFLGLYGPVGGTALVQLNYELLVLPPATVSAFNPDAPFVLFFAGVMLLIISGIGYFIQRIAK